MSSARTALAIDVGGSHATCALVEDRRILISEHIPISDARELRGLLPGFAAALERLLGQHRLAAADCAGMGMSFPGIVDPFSGRIFSTPRGKYDDASSLNLPQWCQERFGLPLRIENDAKMALLGERNAGAAQSFDEVVMITIGTGIGGAAMMGGRLLRGKHFGACLGGHLPVAFHGRKCLCGNIGCVEAEASTWALPDLCRSWPGFAASALAQESSLDFAALFRLSTSGDAVACQIRDRCLEVWAAGAVGLIHAYDPEIFVFGGSVMNSSSQILPFLENYIGAHAWTPWGKVQLRAARLGSDAALLGAIPLLKETC